MRHKINSALAIGILILLTMTCNFSFSTANLSDVKFGKDKTASAGTTSFKPEDEIFAATTVNDSNAKTKVKFRVLFDKAEGAEAGAVAYKIKKELPVEGIGAVSFNFSLPAGFASGTYKAVFVLIDDNGKELDRKTGNFTVEGKSAKPNQPNTDKTDSETDDNQDQDTEDK